MSVKGLKLARYVKHIGMELGMARMQGSARRRVRASMRKLRAKRKRRGSVECEEREERKEVRGRCRA